MKITLPLIVVLLAAGCSGCGMPNSDIAHEIKYCRDHGLGVRYLRYEDGRTGRIECTDEVKP